MKLAESDGTTGFRSMTSFAPMMLSKAVETRYSPDGLKYGYSGQYRTSDCDVVCFESAPAEQGGGLALHGQELLHRNRQERKQHTMVY